MIFETERLTVRRFIPGDAGAFFQLNGSDDVMRYIRPAKNKQDCDAFLLENTNLYRDGSVIGRYAVTEKATGKVIGMFSLLYLAGQADLHIGYAFLPSEWGKGYATEITKKGTAWFFECTDKPELFAITDISHEASQKVLKKAGFRKKEERLENGKTLVIFQIPRNSKNPMTD